jgi:hypothetical protein
LAGGQAGQQQGAGGDQHCLTHQTLSGSEDCCNDTYWPRLQWHGNVCVGPVCVGLVCVGLGG